MRCQCCMWYVEKKDNGKYINHNNHAIEKLIQSKKIKQNEFFKWKENTNRCNQTEHTKEKLNEIYLQQQMNLVFFFRKSVSFNSNDLNIFCLIISGIRKRIDKIRKMFGKHFGKFLTYNSLNLMIPYGGHILCMSVRFGNNLKTILSITIHSTKNRVGL